MNENYEHNEKFHHFNKIILFFLIFNLNFYKITYYFMFILSNIYVKDYL